jgi:hypothetical protein
VLAPFERLWLRRGQRGAVPQSLQLDLLSL